MKRRVIEPEQRRQEADARESLRRVLEELAGVPDPEAERAWLAEWQQQRREPDRRSVAAMPANRGFAQADAALSACLLPHRKLHDL